MSFRTIVLISKLGAGTGDFKGALIYPQLPRLPYRPDAPSPVPRRGRRGADRRLAGRGRAGGGRAGAAARAGAGPLPRGRGGPRGGPRRPGAGDVHPRVPCGREVPSAVPVPHLAPDDRGQRPEGRGAAVPTGAGGAPRRRAALARRRPARDGGGRRNGGTLAGGPGAAGAYAAGGGLAPRAAEPGVRRDRRRPGHVARRGPRALSPRRQTTEGVPAVNMDEELQDAMLRELARLLGSGAAERVDVERTVQAVVTRLRERPRVTLTGWVWMQPAWLKIAAVIALLSGAGVVTRGLLREPRPPALVAPLGEDLTDLTTDQRRQTVGALAQT